MSADPGPVVELSNVSFAYPPRGARMEAEALQVLNDVSLRVGRGEFVCLLGPSGCGKTTLLNLIAGFTRPTGGEVRVRGETARCCPARCGMVFQVETLFPWLTVRENVAFGPSCRGDSAGLAEADRFIEMVGLGGFGDYLPSELSGGMRQRAALARALVSRTDLLLLDEPFGSLDAQNRELMQELVVGIHASLGPTVLMITHDIEEAVFLADRIVLLSRLPGRIVENVNVTSGRPRTLAMRETPAAASLRGRLRSRLRE